MESLHLSTFNYTLDWLVSSLFIAVVYEHRSRLEKILQKEKSEHKITREGNFDLVATLHIHVGLKLHKGHGVRCPAIGCLGTPAQVSYFSDGTALLQLMKTLINDCSWLHFFVFFLADYEDKLEKIKVGRNATVPLCWCIFQAWYLNVLLSDQALLSSELVQFHMNCWGIRLK